MECYNLSKYPEDNDPKYIDIPEFEGSQYLGGLGFSSDKFLKPLKFKKVNTGSPENPKFTNIGDC